jgi:L-malate glycosyltransferase
MKTVLHVLPHPGGGGETYVDTLARMDGYRFERMFLAPSSKPALAALRSGIQVQLAARHYDLLHVHGEVAGAICLLALAIRPSVVTLHGLNLLRRLDGRAHVAAAVNLRLVVRAASATICVAEAEREDLLAVVGPRAARSVVAIHNGVDLSPTPSAEERAAARAAIGLSAEDTVGVFVGSLDERKDPLTAARAAADVARDGPQLVLLVVGEGPLRRQLKQVARESRAVRLLGFRSDVRAILAAADFFVLPSHREGLSYGVLEAMSLGLPTVVSDAPGNPEAVGETGIVVRRGDTPGFANAFRRLLSDEERKTLGARARERIAHRFTAEGMVRRTRRVYEKVSGVPVAGA